MLGLACKTTACDGRAWFEELDHVDGDLTHTALTSVKNSQMKTSIPITMRKTLVILSALS